MNQKNQAQTQQAGSESKNRITKATPEKGVPVFDRIDEMYEYFNDIKGGNIVGFTHDADGKIISPLKYRYAEPIKYKKEIENLSKSLMIVPSVVNKYPRNNGAISN